MPVCPKCGVEVAENEKFCNACGAEIKSTAEPVAEPAAENTFSAEKLKELNNTKDTTAEFDAADIENNKILSLFAYLGLLFLVPLFACPNSKYARFHTNQGIVLLIANVVATVAVSVLTGIATGVGMAVEVLGVLLGLLVGLLGFAVSVIVLVLAIIGIINAVQGKAKELPVIGRFKILK